MRIRDVVQKTCLRRWTIRKSGERGSGISVLPAHDDDDDDNFQNISIPESHRPDILLRTIISVIGTDLYNVAKSLVIMITPLSIESFFFIFVYLHTVWFISIFPYIWVCFTILFSASSSFRSLSLSLSLSVLYKLWYIYIYIQESFELYDKMLHFVAIFIIVIW